MVFAEVFKLKPNIFYKSNFEMCAVRKEKTGNMYDAIEEYSKAIEINPEDASAYYNRGNKKSDLKDYRGAIKDYSKAIEIDPENASAYYNRESQVI